MAAAIEVTDLKLEFAGWLALAAHAALFGAALLVATRGAWMAACAASAALSLAVWVRHARRYRDIVNTPTAAAGTAAQGRVELYGSARVAPGQRVLSHFSGAPCAWHCHRIDTRDEDSATGLWWLASIEASAAPFVIEDESGRCLVDPARAEFLIRPPSVTHYQGHRRTEWVLPEGTPVYVLGEYATVGGRDGFDARAHTGKLLSDLKSDRGRLQERYDANRDGRIDAAEWDNARADAERDALAHGARLAREAGESWVRAPRDGRLFLISNLDPATLAGLYRRWSAMYAVLFAAAATASGVLLLS
ncbi:MAG: hypothetical protein JNM79_13565 [Burkholderiales bacterium]|nr:hypothetical protein [Burkholderiales bacterium]